MLNKNLQELCLQNHKKEQRIKELKNNIESLQNKISSNEQLQNDLERRIKDHKLYTKITTNSLNIIDYDGTIKTISQYQSDTTDKKIINQIINMKKYSFVISKILYNDDNSYYYHYPFMYIVDTINNKLLNTDPIKLYNDNFKYIGNIHKNYSDEVMFIYASQKNLKENEKIKIFVKTYSYNDFENFNINDFLSAENMIEMKTINDNPTYTYNISYVWLQNPAYTQCSNCAYTFINDNNISPDGSDCIIYNFNNNTIMKQNMGGTYKWFIDIQTTWENYLYYINTHFDEKKSIAYLHKSNSVLLNTSDDLYFSAQNIISAFANLGGDGYYYHYSVGHISIFSMRPNIIISEFELSPFLSSKFHSKYKSYLTLTNGNIIMFSQDKRRAYTTDINDKNITTVKIIDCNQENYSDNECFIVLTYNFDIYVIRPSIPCLETDTTITKIKTYQNDIVTTMQP